jgi:hypothetical protein
LRAGLGAIEWVKDASAQQFLISKFLGPVSEQALEEKAQQFLTGYAQILDPITKGAISLPESRLESWKDFPCLDMGRQGYHRMEMDVKPPDLSVYSYLTFRPQHTGNWKAEARDGDHVLSSLNFRVTQSSGDRSL